MVAPQPLQRACCVCHRVQVGTRWVRRAATPKAPTLVTHTYCPTCFHQALAQLRPPPSTTPFRPAALVLACG